MSARELSGPHCLTTFTEATRANTEGRLGKRRLLRMAHAFATTLRPRWSFTGCGLLGGYYLGAWHALSRPNVPSALFSASASSFSGASAGALVSTAIASGCSHESTTSAFERIAERVRTAGLLRCDLLALVRTEVRTGTPAFLHPPAPPLHRLCTASAPPLHRLCTASGGGAAAGGCARAQPGQAVDAGH